MDSLRPATRPARALARRCNSDHLHPYWACPELGHFSGFWVDKKRQSGYNTTTMMGYWSHYSRKKDVVVLDGRLRRFAARRGPRGFREDAVQEAWVHMRAARKPLAYAEKAGQRRMLDYWEVRAKEPRGEELPNDA